MRQSASSPPSGSDPARKRRCASLRRRKATHVSGFAPGDCLIAVWDAGKREWKLLIESANGLRIEHKVLTTVGAAA